MPLYAHSLSGLPVSTWEKLEDHLAAVSRGAGQRAEAFGWSAAGRAAGLLHDIGKAASDFQTYIGAQASGGVLVRSVDHSTAGAREAVARYKPIGKLLAFVIAGHHAGLSDGEDLARRLDPARTILPDSSAWQSLAELPSLAALAECKAIDLQGHKGFAAAYLTRMLFSCLVDADFVETERFYDRRQADSVVRGDFTPLDALAARLRAYLETLRRTDTEVNLLRSRVLDHATARAELPPGLFTLTVPTGGGKTLTSLSFALEHARCHGLRRVVYVIPYTSIIEQTAEVFRDALKAPDDVLEHHASFDWEAALPRNARPADADMGEGHDGLDKLRRSTENWDAPVIVTTAVQFFESLFANRTSRCRKLHNLARAVIVLDEAQTLPLPLLHPCLAALDQLVRNYGASVVLCTATQPALRIQDSFAAGLDIPDDRELAPDPPALYTSLKRVQVERLPGTIDDDTIAARFVVAKQMLCIVNSRAHAHALFGLIGKLDGATHLTTLMCPRHRRAILRRVRQDLRDGKPVRLVATSLIEAGVDVDFPEVWRAMTGLDQIAQAAGRCNREGRRSEPGRVVVFEPAEAKPPRALAAACGEAEAVFAHHADPLSHSAVRAYFRQLYWVRGAEAFDAARLDGRPYRILQSIADRASTLDFPFASVARVFRLIDEAMEPVIVPWQESPNDTRAQDLLRRIGGMDRPLRDDLRRLQQYVVPVPNAVRAVWLAAGVLRPVHPALGDAMLRFEDDSLYDQSTGLRIFDPTQLSVARLIVSEGAHA